MLLDHVAVVVLLLLATIGSIGDVVGGESAEIVVIQTGLGDDGTDGSRVRGRRVAAVMATASSTVAARLLDRHVHCGHGR